MTLTQKVRDELIERSIALRNAGRNVPPVRHPVTLAPYPVTYAYRERHPRYQNGYHPGEDYAAPIGSLVLATTWGTVDYAGPASERWGASYGLQVIVRMADGSHDYGHCHLSKVLVAAGDRVVPGTVLGLVGMTGMVTGAHSHFEARPPGGRYGSDVAPSQVRIDQTPNAPATPPKEDKPPRDKDEDPDPAGKTRPAYLATFNPHNRAGALTAFLRDLEDRVDAGKLPGMPDRITLCETVDLYDELPGLAARFGYDVHQEKPLRDAEVKPEHGSTTTLTRRKTFKVAGARVDPMDTPWRVHTADRTHRPRRFQRIVGSIAEAGIKRGVFVSAHGPTNGLEGGNRSAFAEAAAYWRRTLLVTRPGSLAVVDGDLNDQAGDLRKWAGRVLPSLLFVAIAGHSVDVLMVRGATVRTIVLEDYGSDHRAVFWVVTPRPTLREQIAKARKRVLGR